MKKDYAPINVNPVEGGGGGGDLTNFKIFL